MIPNFPPTPKIVAHHVGARGFGVSFYVPEQFRDDVVHVLYEADAECVERMLAKERGSVHAQMLAEKHVLPYCLGRARAKAALNVTANSYASSVFTPNPKFFRNYCEIPIDAAIYDVVYGEMLDVVRKVEVEVQAIDQLFAEGKIPVQALPDFLSLDTQGYELEILEGARETVAQGVLGLVCEVEMQSMYSGQPLLGDILGHLGRNGFVFAGFTAFYEVTPFRAAIGLRGKAFPGFGDALFLRDLDGMTEEAFGADRLYVMLMKLAFISAGFSYTEYALRALELAEAIRPRVDRKLVDAMAARKYPRFLEELRAAAGKQEALFPPIHAVPDDSRPEGDVRTSWYNKHHQAALKRYQEAIAAAAAPPPPPPAPAAPVAPAPAAAVAAPVVSPPEGPIPPAMRATLGRVARRFLPPHLVGALRRAVTPVEPAAVVAPATEAAPAPSGEPPAAQSAPAPAAPAPHPWTAIKEYTPFERVLEDWGYAGPAYHVRQRRLATERYVRSLDPQMLRDGAEAHLPRG
jgi:FkbM family methyltransferase